MDQNKKERTEFSCGECVRVEIEFLINEPTQGCHIACIVTNQEGYHIFSTADDDKVPDRLLYKRLPGKYVVNVDLPTSLLNVGTYNLAIGLGIAGRESFDRQEALSFYLIDTGDFGTLKEGSRRSGLLLVEANWNYA